MDVSQYHGELKEESEYQKTQHAEKKRLPKLFLQRSFRVTEVNGCRHISHTKDKVEKVWVSDYGTNTFLINTTGGLIQRLKRAVTLQPHTLNSDDELIYIHESYNIHKLSMDMEKTETFIKITDHTWTPMCVYCSPFTGDILVALRCAGSWIGKKIRYNETGLIPETKEKEDEGLIQYEFKPGTGKVTRYDQTGGLIQTIQYDNKGQELFLEPYSITDNNNGDFVVSDSLRKAVVVTKYGGKHRFSYTGHPLALEFRPSRICTDALSHILVCDVLTKSIHLIDKDGQFLSYLLVKPEGLLDYPSCLSYDDNNHLLWVGSSGNNICVYRYMTGQGH